MTCFISYSKINKAEIIKFQNSLQRSRITVWRDDDKLIPTSNLYAQLDDAIRKHDYFICCWSEAYSKSDSCKL